MGGRAQIDGHQRQVAQRRHLGGQRAPSDTRRTDDLQHRALPRGQRSSQLLGDRDEGRRQRPQRRAHHRHIAGFVVESSQIAGNARLQALLAHDRHRRRRPGPGARVGGHQPLGKRPRGIEQRRQARHFGARQIE